MATAVVWDPIAFPRSFCGKTETTIAVPTPCPKEASLGQGVGTAIVVSVFPQKERGKAIGSHTTAVAIGAAGGPVLAGVLLQFFSWQVIFLVVAFPAVLAFFWGLLILDDKRIGSFQAEDRLFDWSGAVLTILLMLFFVTTLNSPFPSDYDFWVFLLGIPGSIILLITFIFLQLRTPSPLLDLKLFSNRIFSYSSLTRFLGFTSRSGGMLLLPVFLLNIRGLDELIHPIRGCSREIRAITTFPRNGW